MRNIVPAVRAGREGGSKLFCRGGPDATIVTSRSAPVQFPAYSCSTRVTRSSVGAASSPARGGTKGHSRPRPPTPTVRFDTPAVPKSTVARARRRQLCGSLPRRYQSRQLPAPAGANCAVRYPGGTKVGSCPRPPTPTLRFDTPAVLKSTVARARRRQLCGPIPRRYQRPQLPAPADANCAVRYPGGTKVDSCPRPPTPTVRFDTAEVVPVVESHLRGWVGCLPLGVMNGEVVFGGG
jgi:hypothetical protein